MFALLCNHLHCSLVPPYTRCKSVKVTFKCKVVKLKEFHATLTRFCGKTSIIHLCVIEALIGHYYLNILVVSNLDSDILKVLFGILMVQNTSIKCYYTR